MHNQHTYLVVLAGGEGTRFAPLSTPERPKQFLQLFGERSMLQATLDRFPMIPPARVLVTTNARYVPLVREHCPHVPVDNICAEPQKKNTAPALALAAHRLATRDPDALMIVVPADHVILDAPAFLRAMQTAVTLARGGEWLVTLSIAPDRPATEYGYIERDRAIGNGAFAVKQFREKPSAEVAREYVASGNFSWNSGMFIWTAAMLLQEVAEHLPALHDALGVVPHAPTTCASAVPDWCHAFFARAPSISIDYGIMEPSRRIATVPVACGWNDIGTWDSLRALVARHGIAVNAQVRPYLESVA